MLNLPHLNIYERVSTKATHEWQQENTYSSLQTGYHTVSPFLPPPPLTASSYCQLF